MTFVVYDFYKKNCGAYNKILINMSFIYNVFRFLPFVLFGVVLIIAVIFSSVSTYIILVGVVTLFTSTFILTKYLHKNARNIVVSSGLNQSYTGIWNNPKVLDSLLQSDKQDIIKFLENKKIYSKTHIERIRDEIELLIVQYKPGFPVIPTFFGALVVAWYSAFIGRLFDLTEDLNMLIYPVVTSLLTLFFIGLIYFIYKMIVEALNDVFFKEEYHKLRRFKRVVNDILFDIVLLDENRL